jgi:hypothetical protein
MTLFLVFAYDSYYPSGGWGDFKGGYATLEEAQAREAELKRTWDWVDIVDLREELVDTAAEKE